MRTIVLLVISCFVVNFSFGQNTTDEEYNYMNKGLKIQIESGLDMKKGYVLSEKISGTCTDRDCWGIYYFSLLLREKDKSIAGIVVWLEKTHKGVIEPIFGIPYGQRAGIDLIKNFSVQGHYNTEIKYIYFSLSLMYALPKLVELYHTNKLQLEQ